MEETKMILSQMYVTKYIEDLKQYGIIPDEQYVVRMVESIPKNIKSRMNAKQYKKVTEVQFIPPRYCKDSELIRLLTIGESEYDRYLKDFRDYTSIVEVLTTASMLGYYISGYTVYRGSLWIDFEKDFKYNNITPDLIEFISRTVENNVIEEDNNSMNKITVENNDKEDEEYRKKLEELGMP